MGLWEENCSGKQENQLAGDSFILDPLQWALIILLIHCLTVFWLEQVEVVSDVVPEVFNPQECRTCHLDQVFGEAAPIF